MARGNDKVQLRELIKLHTGVIWPEDREEILELRLLEVLASRGFKTLTELVEHLQGHPFSDALDEVVDALTTHETSFFRDDATYDALREQIIPELIERNRSDRSLRIWCAACSTGQEPYSIAILLREHFPELEHWRVSILATDVSRGALQQARLGEYSELEVQRGMPAHLRDKHMTKIPNGWAVRSSVKQLVDCRMVNLVAPWPALPEFDLVLLRNVLIYFEPEHRRDVLRRMRTVLKPNGTLLLGGSESTTGIDPSYVRAEPLFASRFSLRAGTR